MKKFLIYAVLYLVLHPICAQANFKEKASAASLAGALPRNRHRHILGVTSGAQDTLVITTWEEGANVDETCVRVISCDQTGRIREASEFAIRHVMSPRSTDDPNVPVVWLCMADHFSPKELWVAERDGTKLQTKCLLREEPEAKQHFKKCWLLELDGKKKLFVEKYGFKKTRLKGELYLLPAYWLYCYALDNGDLKLEGKTPIGEGKMESYQASIECGVVQGKVYVWVCEHIGKLSKKSVLRVAQWRNQGELKWSECYKGGYVQPLTVDPRDGSVAAIFEWQRNQPYPSAIVCQLPQYVPRCANLGYGFGGKHQLLRVEGDRVKWLLFNYEAWNMRILALDDKLKQVKEIKRSYPNSADLHLVRANDLSCYVVILMEDHIKIEKLKELMEARPVIKEQPQDVEELSQQMVLDAYKRYMEVLGKDLVKPTNSQLAKDITQRSDESSIVSYYRLLSRDKKRAERSLAERITSIVKGGVGKEHWITDMQLALYGEPAIKPLLKIAATGGTEERRIAVGILCIIGDVGVVEELIKLLDKPEVRKDRSTFLMLCEMALMAGKPEGMDFLIKAATSKIVDEGTYEERERVRRAREIVIEVTRDYKDTPETWAEKDWSDWWKKHPDIVELVSETADERAHRRRDPESPHRWWRELAKMLEKNRDD